jgi:acetylcholinesterase
MPTRASLTRALLRITLPAALLVLFYAFILNVGRSGKYALGVQGSLPAWLSQPIEYFTDRSPRVTLRQGTVVGRVLQGEMGQPIDAFRGIPYALSPIGDRRFRAAVPVNSNLAGIISATDFGPR